MELPGRRGRSYSPMWALLARSPFLAGSEYFDGLTGTVGLIELGDPVEELVPLLRRQQAAQRLPAVVGRRPG